MRIFVYEYACVRGVDAGLPDSILVEGRTMRDAIAADFARIAGVAVSAWGPVPAAEEEHRFRAAAAAADYTLVIAPEFDSLLETRSRWVEESCGRLLGSLPSGVRLAADKFETYRLLCRQGVPTVETCLAADAGRAASFTPPLVVKPRYGAGSVGIRIAAAGAALPASADWIVQPKMAGLAASASFLVGEQCILPLRAGRQLLDENFRYRGGRMPLVEALSRRALALGAAAVAALPGLRGFVGVDMVLGDAAEVGNDRVIEINPRLTTSYVGLRALTPDNLALALVQTIEGRAAAIRWRPGTLVFDCTGRCVEGTDLPPGA